MRLLNRGVALVGASAALVLGGTLAMAPTAAAGENSPYAYTTDPSPTGGRARFIANGDIIQACDLHTDNYYVWGQLYYFAGAFIESVREETTGDCDGDSHDIEENRFVEVETCLGDSTGANVRYCTAPAGWTVGIS
ncbi:hypothetical protein [Streptomyces sporangiiformans]|uniref:Secreted protein n=1 Tax=Streptomyces sporangiiformans TaxID=2315329 RepID=A0A505D2V5_9ACTN|nr:hypothetical protein [Streptomyces sporangiiformans]TPQ18783.1 hypothetical protein FGD71_029110 [Streptomyces sporangiiformans]